MFRDFDRGGKNQNDFIESVQKSMEFYIQYKSVRSRERNIANNIKLVMQLGLIKGPQFIIAMLKYIEIQKKLFVLELEQGKEV